MTLSDEAWIYWRACNAMRRGPVLERPAAAHNLICLGVRDEDGPVTARARKQINEAVGVLAMFDAA